MIYETACMHTHRGYFQHSTSSATPLVVCVLQYRNASISLKPVELCSLSFLDEKHNRSIIVGVPGMVGGAT